MQITMQISYYSIKKGLIKLLRNVLSMEWHRITALVLLKCLKDNQKSVAQ